MHHVIANDVLSFLHAYRYVDILLFARDVTIRACTIWGITPLTIDIALLPEQAHIIQLDRFHFVSLCYC